MNNFEYYKEKLKEATEADALFDFALKHHIERYNVDTFVNWLLQEYKEPILTDKEKEVFSSVIKPFIDSAISIIKHEYNESYEYIEIFYNEKDGNKDVISFPFFEKGTMFKGMQTEISYSIEELGL